MQGQTPFMTDPRTAHRSEIMRAARQLLRGGNPSACVELCRAAAARFPRDRTLPSLEGLALLDLGRAGEAEAVFRGLVEQAPDAAAGYLGLARLHARAVDDDGCIATAAEARRRGILDPQLVLLHGQALLRGYRFAELRDLLVEAFDATGVMDRQGRAGPSVSDRRVALPGLIELYWKASIGCGDHAGAARFQNEITLAREQGEAMTTLFGGCARHLPYVDNTILGVA